MQIAVVVGSVVSTIKDPRLSGMKLLLVRGSEEESSRHRGYVAVDLVGAGDGETVLVTRGSAAAAARDEWGQGMPIDAVIIGIVDTINDVASPPTSVRQGSRG